MKHTFIKGDIWNFCPFYFFLLNVNKWDSHYLFTEKEEVTGPAAEFTPGN